MQVSLQRRVSMTARFALCVIAGFVLAPATAHAASTVYGDDGPMQRCFVATQTGTADDEAMHDCDTAVENNRISRRDRTSTIINRGVLYLQRRAGAPALADFDTAIERDPRNAEAHLNRGAALLLLRRNAEAVSAITIALGYGVSAPHKAYFNRAAAREALGDVRGAYEDYNTALTIRPDWGVAEAELARFARGRRERLASQLDAANETKQ